MTEEYRPSVWSFRKFWAFTMGSTVLVSGGIVGLLWYVFALDSILALRAWLIIAFVTCLVGTLLLGMVRLHPEHKV
jgi:hypothetical protein